MTGGGQLVCFLVQALTWLQSSEPSLFGGSAWTLKRVVFSLKSAGETKGDCSGENWSPLCS